MATHILKAEITVPRVEMYPTELLKIDSFRLEIHVDYHGSPIACETIEEAVGLVKLIYKEEMDKRNRT